MKALLLQRAIVCILSLVILCGLSGCVTVRNKVTTFHDGGISTGSIAIAPAPGIPDSAEFRTYAAILQRGLDQKGFTPAWNDHPDYLGLLSYGIASGGTYTSLRTTYGPGWYGRGRLGVNGISATSYRYFSRVLQLSIVNKLNDQEIWKGRVTSTGMSGEINRVLPTMVTALLRDFPGTSGVTRSITLPLQ